MTDPLLYHARGSRVSHLVTKLFPVPHYRCHSPSLCGIPAPEKGWALDMHPARPIQMCQACTDINEQEKP